MVHVLVLAEFWSKSDPKTQPEIFVGYMDDLVIYYKIFDPYSSCMAIHSNVLFDETQFLGLTIAISPSQKMSIQNLKNAPDSAVSPVPSQPELRDLSRSRESSSNEVLKKLEPLQKKLPLLSPKTLCLLLLASKPPTNLKVAAKTSGLFTLVPKMLNTAKLMQRRQIVGVRKLRMF